MINLEESTKWGWGRTSMHEPGAAAQSLILTHKHKTERANWEQHGLLKPFTCTHTCTSHTHAYAHKYLYTHRKCVSSVSLEVTMSLTFTMRGI